MEFYRFLQRESKDFDRKILIAGVIAGFLHTVMIIVLAAAANKVASGRSDWRELALVALSLWGFWKSKGYMLERSALIVEKVIEKVRIRLAEKIRQSELPAVEQIGRAPLFNAVSSHAANISRATTMILSATTALVLLICASVVMFFMSQASFIIFAATLALLAIVFIEQRKQIMKALFDVATSDNKFVASFSDLLDGFKELKMNSAKAHEFCSETLVPSAEIACGYRTKTSLMFNKVALLASSSLFIMLIAVVFLLPILSAGDDPKIVKIVTLIVFMFGPLGEIVAVFPNVTEAEASIRELSNLEQKLDSGLAANARLLGPKSVSFTLEKITCRDMSFAYRDEKGQSSFSLSPFNFEIRKGEVVFITGGNGSGKSTFLKVFSGLYPPSQGEIVLNDVPIGPHNRQEYQNLFAPIFADFHLFDRLYGILQVDEKRVHELLLMTELSTKTSIIDRGISTLDLSSGQKKRLALLVALLEDKEIYLFDEWAAEQDPQFRRKFYRQLIPDLKKAGKTVIAVTHDDDFYDCADRVLKMQYGQFVPAHA